MKPKPNMHKNFILIFLIISNFSFSQKPEEKIKLYVDSIYQKHPNSVGIMVNIQSEEKNFFWNYAIGYSDKNNNKIDAEQPALIASNTKTYVSAAILKLVENKKLELNQSIENLINKKTKKILLKNGYLKNKITIKNLLSHTSGITDYVNDGYFDFVNLNKNHQWTRDEQIKLAMKSANPSILPNDTFTYADINYLLLSEIIENITKKSYYSAIEELLEFKENNLTNTWFIQKQKQPKNSKSLVHQYWNKYTWDSYDLNPSWDLYGGGGLVSNTKDLSVFFQRLFERKIIHDQNILDEMYKDISPKTNYCLGIRKISMSDLTGYYHGGFWGTDVIYFPELKTAISIFVLEKNERDISIDICKKIVEILKINIENKKGFR